MNLEVSGLRRVFDGVVALENINLSVPSGEFLALLGPSGSGKTTLLRVLAGLEFADTGRILIGGEDMSGVPARSRRIGFVFQHYALFRHMTVARNVAFGLSIRPRATRPPAPEIRRRVGELLDMMGIGDLGERLPSEISGGQRQRVALARALAIEPNVLLLDEPFGALDAKVRRNLRIWLRELHDRMGLTSVFVTHDQDEAVEMADRVAVMRAGRIEQVDTPERLYAAPATAFVDEFLGEVVRLPCHVREGVASLDPLPLPPLPARVADGPAVALIRPHEIGLTLGDGPGRVESVHVAGPIAHVRVGLGPMIVEVDRPAMSGIPGIGETCALDVGRARVYADHAAPPVSTARTAGAAPQAAPPPLPSPAARVVLDHAQ